MEEGFERYHPDMEAFHHGMRTKPCFVCEIVAGVNELPQHFVYEDDVLKIPQEEKASLATRIGARAR